MKPLSIAHINEVSPYRVWGVSAVDYVFTTDFGVLCNVGFMPDDTISGAYQLLINNVNDQHSPNDSKLKEAIFAIVEEFFVKGNQVLLYICETGDGRQAARSRLFLKWFGDYGEKEQYIFKSATIRAEGIDNYAAIIVRKEDAQYEAALTQFDVVVKTLTEKP